MYCYEVRFNSLNELINANQLRQRSRSYNIPFSQNNITSYKEKNDKQMIIKECDFFKKGIWKKKKYRNLILYNTVGNK